MRNFYLKFDGKLDNGHCCFSIIDDDYQDVVCTPLSSIRLENELHYFRFMLENYFKHMHDAYPTIKITGGDVVTIVVNHHVHRIPLVQIEQGFIKNEVIRLEDFFKKVINEIWI